jgi:thiol-disulfide isomerase/thioredoxin
MPRSQHALLTATALCLLTAGCVVSAGKFDAYKTCDVCIAAGFGWHAKKGRCGGYPNKVCATGTKPAPSKAPPSLSTLTELTDKTFEGAVGSGIVLVNYYGSSCQSCDEVKSALERAADQVGAAKIVRVDASAQSGAATDYGILGKTIPSLVLFRDGEMVTQVDPTIWSHHLPSKITEKIVTYLNVHAKTVEDGEEDGEWDDDDEDDEDEPEILRFSMANAQSLMSHRLKHQLVLFMSEEDKRSGKAVEQLEEALRNGGYADKALGLHIPTDIRENNPVLERFFVDPTMTPALRIAVMYPKGNGLKVYGARGHEGQRGALRDGSLKGLKEFTNALIDHFAGKSEPLLKSESEPGTPPCLGC